MGAFCALVLPCGQCYPRDQNNHTAVPVKVARQQTTPELSGTFRTLPPEPTPTRAGTFQNPLKPSETFRNQPFGTFRNLPPGNLPELASGSYTILHRNSPEPTPRHARTLRNLLPELAPATRTGTHQSLSGLKTPLAYAVGEKLRKISQITLNKPRRKGVFQPRCHP